MTRPLPAHPEPTTGSDYDTYLVPRSKTPEKQALIEQLLDLGWRFDAVHKHWHTPERNTLQGFGALQYATDYSWAKVQPPIPYGDDRLPPPLIRLRRLGHTMTWLAEEN